ncbi:MAG: response regulator [Proteobacteria bacterium]|nr:response regulator [Pseudomonadota bacterium]MBU1738509.1 response regulator [Pseudomonadota bacterium]
MEDIILFVDDDEKILAAMRRELMDEDLTALTAGSASEALEVLARMPCKVIVADVKMPGTNGFELLEMAKEINPKIVRMILSGHADVELILAEVNRKGIDRYIVKPWDPGILKKLLCDGVELYDLRQSAGS